MPEQEVPNMGGAVLQEPDGDHDRLPRALRSVTFFFMFVIVAGFVHIVVNSSSSSSVAIEDVLTLFLIWILSLVIFFASFDLRVLPGLERLPAWLVEALSRFLLPDRDLLLF